MTREIKFRALENNEMRYDFWQRCDLGNYLNSVGVFKDVKIMQYTGLKDKNGKEIYEGDIGIYNGWIVEVRWDGKMAYYYVEFNKYQFKSEYRVKLHECYLTIKPYTMNFEIIGNVFENPKLMEE